MRAYENLPCFYRTLAQLLRSGVLASEALRGSLNFLPAAGAATEQVEAGRPLSAALAATGALPAEHVRLIGIGEKCGGLDRVLESLAEATERLQAAGTQMRNGLILPAVMLHAAAFILPLPTLVLGGNLAGYAGSALGFVALFWLAVAAGTLAWRKTTPARKDVLLAKIPVVRAAWEHFELWRMLDSLALTAKTSMGFPDALRFAGEACFRAQRRLALERAADAVEQRGGKVSVELAASGQFPKELIVFWTNGEATGRLDDVFAQLAARYFEAFQQTLAKLAKLLPKCAYAIVALYLILQIFRAGAAYAARLSL